MERGLRVTGDLGLLARAACPAQAPNIGRNPMPDKTALDVGDRGVGSRMGKAVHTVKDSLDPGGRHNWPRDRS